MGFVFQKGDFDRHLANRSRSSESEIRFSLGNFRGFSRKARIKPNEQDGTLMDKEMDYFSAISRSFYLLRAHKVIELKELEVLLGLHCLANLETGTWTGQIQNLHRLLDVGEKELGECLNGLEKVNLVLRTHPTRDQTVILLDNFRTYSREKGARWALIVEMPDGTAGLEYYPSDREWEFQLEEFSERCRKKRKKNSGVSKTDKSPSMGRVSRGASHVETLELPVAEQGNFPCREQGNFPCQENRAGELPMP